MATYETTTTITITMLVTTTTTTRARAAEGTRRGGYTEICARRHEISDRAKKLQLYLRKQDKLCYVKAFILFSLH